MKHDTKPALKTFNQTRQGIYWQSFRSHQINIKLILSLIIITQLSLYENFRLDSTTESFLFKLLKNVEVRKAASDQRIDQVSGKFLKDGA